MPVDIFVSSIIRKVLITIQNGTVTTTSMQTTSKKIITKKGWNMNVMQIVR